MSNADDEQVELWRGPVGRRRRRVYDGLRYLGEAQRWWADACRLIVDPAWETGAHGAFHALRELNGLLLDLLAPLEDPQAEADNVVERQRVEEVLLGAGFDESVVTAAQGAIAPNVSRKVHAACQVLGLDDEIAKAWKALPFHRIAHRDNLGMRAITDPVVVEAFAEAERVFGAVAERWARLYPRWFAVVDAIAAGDPSRPNVRRLLESVPPLHELYARFFATMDDPRWLAPLRAGGVLTRVPAGEPSEDGTTIWWLPWTAAPFLRSVVERLPNEVAQILGEVALSENPLALHDVVDIAALLPVDDAAALVEPIASGVRYWRGVRRRWDLVGALVRRLVQEGRPAEAAQLAHAVLELRGPRHVGGDHPQEYAELAAEVVTALSTGGRALGVQVLTDILGGAAVEGDRSVVWLRAVDEPTRHIDDCRPALASQLAAVVTEMVRSEGTEVLERLLRSGVPAAQRVALHVARVCTDVDPSAVLADTTLLVGDELRVDLGLLVRDRWDDLGEAGSRAYLQLVQDGPPPDSVARAEGSPAFVARWRGSYLQPVLARLDLGDELVQSLLDDAIVPEYDVLERGKWRVTTSGPKSPWSPEELSSLDVSALVDRVVAFEPGEGAGGPSRRGIGAALASLVARDVDRYGELAHAASRLAPEYLAGVVSGIATAAGATDWAVLVEAASAAVGWDGEPSDGWSDFTAPARTLRLGALSAIRRRVRQDGEISAEIAEQLTAIVQVCLEDPNPGADDPYLDIGPTGDLPETVRGVALDALIDVFVAARGTNESTTTGVGAALVDALSREEHPYVYPQVARRLYRLVEVYPSWVETHLRDIVGPPASDERRHLLALLCVFFDDPPEGDLAGLLAEHYSAWIARLDGQPLSADEHRFAAHVGALATAGFLDDRDVHTFFAVAPTDGRLAALRYATPTAEDQVDRAAALWEARVAAVEGGSDPDELLAVSSWLASDGLDPLWRLTQLDRVTRLGARMADPATVLARLAVLGDELMPEAGVLLDVVERLLSQADLQQLAWSGDTVAGILDSVAASREDLLERVTSARSTAALRLQDLALLEPRSS